MRRGYVIALIIACLAGFWATGRADSALAPWGLNHGDCLQAFGSYYCGEQAADLHRSGADTYTPADWGG